MLVPSLLDTISLIFPQKSEFHDLRLHETQAPQVELLPRIKSMEFVIDITVATEAVFPASTADVPAEVIADPATRERLRAGSRRLAEEHFSWDRVMDATLKTLRQTDSA